MSWLLNSPDILDYFLELYSSSQLLKPVFHWQPGVLNNTNHFSRHNPIHTSFEFWQFTKVPLSKVLLFAKSCHRFTSFSESFSLMNA